jgi:carboxypeptidase Taq
MTEKMEKITPYNKLLTKTKEVVHLNNISGIVFWDKEVMMPEKGNTQRADEVALFSGILHDRETDPEIGSLLQVIQGQNNYTQFSPVKKRNVNLIQREYDRQTKLPKDFVMEMTKHSALATETWKKAKKKADYSLFQSSLEKMVELVKKQAHYLNPGEDPYDVMLDYYEYGFSKKIYDDIFAEVKKGLLPLIDSCVNSSDQPDPSLIQRKCPIPVQKKIAKDLAQLINYDLSAGRIDEAVHPFTTGFYDDVRLTLAYNENDFSASFFAMLHEGGHALYEQNLPPEYKYQPIGFSCSSAMHEGQARFIENVIGRSPSFWEYYLPRFQKLTDDIFTDVDKEAFIKAINRVIPSKIRIHADPVTYSMHIILRYEIEKDLFEDKVTIKELPSIWNEKMGDYLGLEIENDAEGLLQDTHWSWGMIGYFPTYALGSYYNGQFLWKMKQDLPEWEEHLRQGNFDPILEWLNTNIRNQGHKYDPLDLVERLTGEKFSSKYYIDYITERYSTIYGF